MNADISKILVVQKNIQIRILYPDIIFVCLKFHGRVSRDRT